MLQGNEDDPVSDQWLPPFVIVGDDGKPVGTVEDGDAVVLFNFRADRMVEISKAFEYEDFKSFDRVRYPKVRSTVLLEGHGVIGVDCGCAERGGRGIELSIWHVGRCLTTQHLAAASHIASSYTC